MHVLTSFFLLTITNLIGLVRQSLPVTWSLNGLNTEPMDYEIPDEPKVTYKTYNTSSASVNETPVIKDSLKQRPKTELRGFHKSKGPTNTEQYDDDVTYDDTGVPVDPMTGIMIADKYGNLL